MSSRSQIAIFFIASSALSTASIAQNVYKCGATYSQMPCESAVPLRVEDARSKDQKAQAESVARQDAKLAASMEKTRLTEAQKTGQPSSKPTKANAISATSPAKQQKSVPVTAILKAETANKGNKSKNKEPEYFTATAASDKNQGKDKGQTK